MKKVTLIFFLVLSIAKIQSQNEFVRGYLVLNNGDTLKGSMKYFQNYELSDAIVVKSDTHDELIKYCSDSILSFCFENNKCFKSFKIAENGSIMSKNFQYVIRGDISFLLLHEKNKTRMFISNRNNELIELYETLKEVGNSKRSNYEYIISLKMEMKDQPNLFQRIDKLRLNINDIAEVVYVYNLNINQGKPEIFRFKKKTTLTPIIYLGLSVYQNTGFKGGIDFKFTKPESRDDISYHFGVFYRTNPYGQEKGDFELVFPLMMEFRLGKKKTKPGIYAGLCPNFYTGFTKCGVLFGLPERRYYGFYPFGITAGMNCEFVVFDKIHLFTDINYSAKAFSLSIGYGF